MNDVPSYVPAYELDTVLDGPAVGEVVASRAEGVAPGDTVVHWQGWRDLALLGGREARKVDTALAPAHAYIGVLGMSGLTAYVGLLDIAALRHDDIVFVSAARRHGGQPRRPDRAPARAPHDRQRRDGREGRPPARRPRPRHGVQLPQRRRRRPAA